MIVTHASPNFFFLFVVSFLAVASFTSKSGILSLKLALSWICISEVPLICQKPKIDMFPLKAIVPGVLNNLILLSMDTCLHIQHKVS